MNQQPTYAQILRKAMRSFDPPMTRRTLFEQMSFSYEHIRKIVAGLPLMSENFNEEVCKVLKLDEQEMWQIALREKMARNGPAIFAMTMPDPRLKNIWSALNSEDQERYLKIGEGMVEQRLAERHEHEEEDPEILQERINFLVSKMKDASTRNRNRPRPIRAAR